MQLSLDPSGVLKNFKPRINAGDVDSYDSLPGASAFRNAMNILTAVLLTVALFGLVGQPFGAAVTGVLLCAGFAAAYVNSVLASSANKLGTQLASIGVLTFIWIVLLAAIPISVYLVFPLYFLYLRALPDYRGTVFTLGITAIAIFSRWPDLTVGSIMGPAVSAMVCIGIHMTFMALWRGSLEREALIKELVDTRQALAETERAAGVAAERQRIAHEIHDTLAQGLSSIQMLLRVAEKDVSKSSMTDEEKKNPLQRMELARRAAADNLSEARAMIAALQPAALSKTSLEGALHRVAEQIVGPEVTIEVEGEERQLPMKTEAGLLRIGQGALGNVAKHANATRCHVTLTYGDDEIRLDVVDNGTGFDPEATRNQPAGLGHIGISAMRQRAAELGGSLDVESAPGEGTAISVALPVGDEELSA